MISGWYEVKDDLGQMPLVSRASSVNSSHASYRVIAMLIAECQLIIVTCCPLSGLRLPAAASLD